MLMHDREIGRGRRYRPGWGPRTAPRDKLPLWSYYSAALHPRCGLHRRMCPRQSQLCPLAPTQTFVDLPLLARPRRKWVVCAG